MTTRVLSGDDWSTWREIRLRSLADSPSAFGSTYERELAYTEATWRSWVGNPGQVAVVALAGDTPVGMTGGYPDLPGLLHVVAMWVDPAHRGRRLAHELLAAVQAQAATRDLRLHLDVNITNLAARRSYERYGFVGTGETRPLRDGSSETVERMLLPDGSGALPSGTPGSR